MTRRQHKTRLVIVGFGFFAASAVLWVRLIDIQYVRHDAYRERALSQHVSLRSIPPVRGTIFDRSGAPLAISVRMCSIALRPLHVRDREKVIRALARTVGITRRESQRALALRRFSYLRRHCALPDSVARQLGRIPGVEVHHIPGRVYPGDELAAKVVGFVNVDGAGAGGIEASLDPVLHGKAGVERVIRNGRYSVDREYSQIQKNPRHGRDVYLTIDSRVQEICELELTRGVTRCGAHAGAAIVVDVTTGDILALAELPTVHSRSHSAPDSMWTLRSVSHVYEPGSTFKIVTASALLETGAVSPADTFYAGNGHWNFPFGKIEDTHAHGVLTFEEAFSVSSNIVMARSARLIDPESFYRYISVFGFGEKTGAGLPAESAGYVPPVKLWSGRTQQTMAFGQEIAVTPLQMLMAMSAIANGGRMMAARVVRGITRENGSVEWLDPVVVRQVISRRTASTMRTFCRRVVERGTGTRARVRGLSVAGKTGTAQKAGRGGYARNRVVASFVGFAPFARPRIACLVLMDEPHYAWRYGGDSAAPVFSAIISAMINSTHWFDDAMKITTVSAPTPGGKPAPNLLRLTRSGALARARMLGVNVLCQGSDGRVVNQVPAPGVAITNDDVIRVQVRRPARGPSASTHPAEGVR